MNDVVAFLCKPVDKFGGLFAVHELERPRRDQLNVGAMLMQRIEMAFGADLGGVQRRANSIIADFRRARVRSRAARGSP